MKFCPNSNCILYHHEDGLRGLPDSYLLCPYCSSRLVNSDRLAGKPPTGHLFKAPSGQLADAGYLTDDFDDEPTEPSQPTSYQVATSTSAEYQVEYEDAQAAVPYSEPAPLPWLTASRVTIALVTLGVFICLVLGLALSTRLFPQSRVVGGPQATETAMASLRPPINTPIPILPTIPSSGYGSLPPGSSNQPPGGTLPTLSPSYPTPVQQPPSGSVPPPGSGPPPAQPQPSGGILGAQMSVRLEGGQPVGNAPVYKPTDPFNLAVQATFGAGSVTSITTRWYGPDGAPIYQLRKDYTQPGTYYVGFTLNKTTPWPTGDYRVDIHTTDSPSPAYTVTFSVIP